MLASFALLPLLSLPATQLGLGSPAPPSLAQAIGVTAPKTQHGLGAIDLKSPRTRLYSDRDGDGNFWVRGTTYKACAGKNGFTYIPFLGSSAPHNFPMRFELTRAVLAGADLELTEGVSARREGDRIVLDQGAVQVRYDLGLDQVEQTFAVDAAGVDGDLELTLRVSTELEGQADGPGYRFVGPAGGVVYGAATVLDGAGRSQPMETRLGWAVQGIDDQDLRPQELTLTVPASFLRSAEGLVVIDPVIATYGVSTILGDQRDVDVAYDDATDRFVYAFEEQFSGADIDLIVMMRRASDGTFNGSRYVDMTSDNWEHPAIASVNGADKCLVVSEAKLSINRRSIRARIYDPVTGAIGPAFAIDSGGLSDRYRPDVGGWASADPNGVFMVVWERKFISTGSTSIFARSVAPDGTLGSVELVASNSGLFDMEIPAISKAAGHGPGPAVWAVAYRQKPHSPATPTKALIRSLDASTQLASPFATAGTVSPGNEIASLDVSDVVQFEGNPYFLACVGKRVANQFLLTLAHPDIQSLDDTWSMHLMEHAPANPLRFEPRIATLDGRFVITYVEGIGNSYNAYLSVYHPVTSTFAGYSERRTRLGFLGTSFRPGDAAAVASKFSGGSSSGGLSGVSWPFDGGGHRDLVGVTHESTVPDLASFSWCYGHPNSTGARGYSWIQGDLTLTAPKTLHSSAVPPGQLGLYIYSGDYLPGGGFDALSSGLCLGGSISRMLDSIGPNTAAGTRSYALDPTLIPSNVGPIAAMAGDLFLFQLWHRDTVGGVATSNFTNIAQLYFVP